MLPKDNLKKIQLDESNDDNVFIIEGVLTEEECREIIERGESMGFEQATVYSTEHDDNIVRKDIRDNHRVLEIFPALSSAVWSIVEGCFPDEIGKYPSIGLIFHLMSV